MWLEARSVPRAATPDVSGGAAPARPFSVLCGHERLALDAPAARARRKGLRTALDSSEVVAAVCRADALPRSLLRHHPAFAEVARPSEPLTQEARRCPILVGLARASTDDDNIAVVDQVLVLPELRQQGLGRRCAWHHAVLCSGWLCLRAVVVALVLHRQLLVARACFRMGDSRMRVPTECGACRLTMLLCARLHRYGMDDIGATVPASAQHCLTQAGWRPDKLGSVAMVLAPDSSLRTLPEVSPNGQSDPNAHHAETSELDTNSAETDLHDAGSVQAAGMRLRSG